MRKGWLPTALTVVAMAGAAHADTSSLESAESVIVIIGEVPTAEPAVVTSLPAMIIEGDVPRHAVGNGSAHDRNAIASFVIDPYTGLALPRTPHDTRPIAPIAPARASAIGSLHVDPATGLIVPDYLHTTSATASANRHHAIDRRTGLMIPIFHDPNRPPRIPTANGMIIDPSTGLMIPAAFAPRRNHPRGP